LFVCPFLYNHQIADTLL